MGILRSRWLLCLLLGAACDRGAGGVPSTGASNLPPLSRAAPAPSMAASSEPAAVLVPAAPAPVTGFASLVRGERWVDAKAALDALPEAERSKPEQRFVRARVALELDDAAVALPLLDGLERSLPALTVQVEAARARAQAKVGPYAEAAAYFERRGDTESLLSAASAYLAAETLPKARLMLDRALARLGKSKRARSAEVRARALRAPLAERLGDKGTAIADYRWLALAAPLRPESDVALIALQRIGGSGQLTKTEHLDRASAFAEAGRIDATEAELGHLAGAPGAPAPVGRITYLRAFALYAARGNHTQAAELFERSAREDPENAARASFYAARALSRAQLDERAIAGYEKLARQFPKSGWAEQAQYLSARLRFIAGEYVKARAQYDKYLAQYGKRARFGNDASYERALCALETDQPAAAAATFARLGVLSKDRRTKARLRYLEALSLGLAGQNDKATSAFTQLANNEPLSFYGLAARSRLRIVGAPQPALIGESSPVSLPPLALALPADVASLNRVGLARDAERELTRQEGSLLRQYSPRGNEALCDAYGLLEVGQRRYRLGQDVVRSETFDSAPTDANRWAWNCIYPRPFEETVRAAAQREQLTPELVYAVMRQESVFDPSAFSGARASGLLQLIAPTARRIAEQLKEPFEPAALFAPDTNIRYGAHYLAQLSGYFDGNPALIAAAYNAGPDAVFRWLDAPEKLGTDGFVARIPFEETRNYVERVLGNLARYQYLSGGEAAVIAPDLSVPKAPPKPADIF